MQYIAKKKVLCSAEKGSVIWAEPHNRSSAKQLGRTECLVGHYSLNDPCDTIINVLPVE